MVMNFQINSSKLILVVNVNNVGYQFPTKLLKLLLLNNNYMRYLFYMHILLRLEIC